jgi:hypothetical protein
MPQLQSAQSSDPLYYSFPEKCFGLESKIYLGSSKLKFGLQQPVNFVLTGCWSSSLCFVKTQTKLRFELQQPDKIRLTEY